MRSDAQRCERVRSDAASEVGARADRGRRREPGPRRLLPLTLFFAWPPPAEPASGGQAKKSEVRDVAAPFAALCRPPSLSAVDSGRSTAMKGTEHAPEIRRGLYSFGKGFFW